MPQNRLNSRVSASQALPQAVDFFLKLSFYFIVLEIEPRARWVLVITEPFVYVLKLCLIL